MKSMERTTRTMIIAIAFVIIALFAAAANAEASTEYKTVKSAGAKVLEKINAHKGTIKIDFESSSRDGNAIAKKIFHSAINQSEIKDYIKYGLYQGYKLTWTAQGYEGKYHFSFKYKVNYRITKAEAAAFETKLTKVVYGMKLQNKGNKAKIKKIYKWITKNVKYDKKSKGTKKYTAYAALINKKAVCQGYSVLFYRMCKKAGVNAKVITGTGNGENHAWNIAKVGKKYYNLDATWDAGRAAKNYKYFLRGNKAFKHHVRNSEFVSNAFYNAYPMAK